MVLDTRVNRKFEPQYHFVYVYYLPGVDMYNKRDTIFVQLFFYLDSS